MAKRRRRIEISLNAKTDLKEIVNFISRGSRKYAALERELIFEAIGKLIEFPDLGKQVEFKSIDTRQYIFRNYLIFYRLKNDTMIEIISIHHHARLIRNNPALGDED